MDTTSAAKRAAVATEHNQRDPPGAGTRAWHTLSAEEVAQALQADPASGLTDAEAARRRQQFGPNALAEAKGRSVLAILVDQFMSLIVVLLLGATVVAFALGENIEAVAVLVVIVLNAAVGFLTEWKAEQALTALQQQTVPTAHVLREGKTRQVPAAELVPGDIVIVETGSRVPADGRIIQSVPLKVAACLLLQVAAVYTPFLQAVLRTTPLTAADWGVVLACSLVPVGVVELVKRGQRVQPTTVSRPAPGQTSAMTR